MQALRDRLRRNQARERPLLLCLGQLLVNGKYRVLELLDLELIVEGVFSLGDELAGGPDLVFDRPLELAERGLVHGTRRVEEGLVIR